MQLCKMNNSFNVCNISMKTNEINFEIISKLYNGVQIKQVNDQNEYFGKHLRNLSNTEFRHALLLRKSQ